MKPVDEQARLRAVVETAVDGVILINAEGIVLLFNPACERMFGYASFEVVGRHVRMLLPEPYDTTLTEAVGGTKREVVGRKRSGVSFPADVSVGETREDGQPTFVGIIRDLTERKRTEQAVREGSARLQRDARHRHRRHDPDRRARPSADAQSGLRAPLWL